MKKHIQLLFAGFLTVGIVGKALADSPTQEDLILQADQLYRLRTDPAQAKAAYNLYETIASSFTESTEALWKASRAAWWVGDQAKNKQEKLNLFQQGIDRAQQAITLNDKCIEAHFWLGGNEGSFGETKGVLKSLFLVKPIRQEMNKVLELDPTYEGGAGYRVLGVVDYKVPGIAGGNKKRAFDNLSKALQMAPENPFNLYYLAEYYDTVGEKDKARTYLQMLSDLQPANDDLKPDLLMMQQKGKILSQKR